MSFTKDVLRGKGFVIQPDGSYSKENGETGQVNYASYGLPSAVQPRQPVAHENDLHHEIMAWCDKQYPRVKYIRARSDQRSTIAVGAQDFTLFLPRGKTICIECKRRDGKLSPEQMVWHKEMEMLGHHIYVARNMEEFRTWVDQETHK